MNKLQVRAVVILNPSEWRPDCLGYWEYYDLQNTGNYDIELCNAKVIQYYLLYKGAGTTRDIMNCWPEQLWY